MSWGSLREVDVESGKERMWQLTTDDVAAGRTTNTKADEKLNIKWSKAFVSGLHFTIKRSADGSNFEIFDKSSNGTFVNSTLIGKGKSSPLCNGDTIQLRFKNEDKIMLHFSVKDDVKDDVKDNNTHNNKRKRVEVDMDSKREGDDDDRRSSFLSSKISALEQDNRQQEARIETYITKLETCAREKSNLLRDLKASQDEAVTKGLQLEELKEQCSAHEVHIATVEARARKLEDSLQSQKNYVEKLRGQLALSEEKSAQANELLLKVETLNDELKHRTSQYDSRASLCDELTVSIDNERKIREEAQLKLSANKLELEKLKVENDNLRSKKAVPRIRDSTSM